MVFPEVPKELEAWSRTLHPDRNREKHVEALHKFTSWLHVCSDLDELKAVGWFRLSAQSKAMSHAISRLLFFTCVAGALSACLNVSDFVPEAQRVDVTINGRAMPIGFAGPNWDSAKLYSHIGAIIAREVLYIIQYYIILYDMIYIYMLWL